MKRLNQILDILSKNNYLTITKVNNVDFKPLGQVLLSNIRSQWKSANYGMNSYSCSTNSPESSLNSLEYFRTEHFRQNLLHVKQNHQKTWPLRMQEESDVAGSRISSDTFEFHCPKDTILTSCYFFNENFGSEKFYSLQRERKIWWMRFSSNPGRYHLTDMKTDEIEKQKISSVRIKSKFAFGELPLETIQVVPLRALQLEKPNDFRLRDQRLNKNDLPVAILSTLSLKAAGLAFLFDALVDNRNLNLTLHRKLAPYQCRILAADEGLTELAKHISSAIEKAGISTRLSEISLSKPATLQKEFEAMDQIGVPYSIILDETSLKNGLMRLRNRDTTLAETIHISDIPDYLNKIFA